MISAGREVSRYVSYNYINMDLHIVKPLSVNTIFQEIIFYISWPKYTFGVFRLSAMLLVHVCIIYIDNGYNSFDMWYICIHAYIYIYIYMYIYIYINYKVCLLLLQCHSI